MRWAIFAATFFVAVPGAAQDELGDQRRRLGMARAAGEAAAARSAALDASADAERSAARAARAREAAVAARIVGAEARIAAARARIAIVAQLLTEQRARLAERQRPVARLLAALQSLARRPAAIGLAQPGSVEDLVRVRAVLGSALPVVAARTAAIRADLAATRRLEASAALAVGSLRDGRAALGRERAALAVLQRSHDRRAIDLDRTALAEADRALALGEEARDIVDRMERIDDSRGVLARLTPLPAPPFPGAEGGSAGVYRLPVAGRLLTGLGEVSASGVRSRGLTFRVAPGATVVAPAAGIVVFARAFRRYGTIVIIDHGSGWTTLLTGLSRAGVARGASVAAGVPVGEAGGGEPEVTVELRRRGRAVDIAALVGE